MRDIFVRRRVDHVRFRDWSMPGKTSLQRIFSAQLFANWCSYTRALLDGVDPTPVALVEDFKRQLCEEEDAP
jgi:hypothetical protein